MVKRLTVSIDDEAGELLMQLAGSPRRQGEVLEGLIRARAAAPPAVIDARIPLTLALNQLTGLPANDQVLRALATGIADSVDEWAALLKESGTGEVTLKFVDRAYIAASIARPPRPQSDLWGSSTSGRRKQPKPDQPPA